jgi:hypothetical protein
MATIRATVEERAIVSAGVTRRAGERRQNGEGEGKSDGEGVGIRNMIMRLNHRTQFRSRTFGRGCSRHGPIIARMH